jgi:hypothetical protein
MQASSLAGFLGCIHNGRNSGGCSVVKYKCTQRSALLTSLTTVSMVKCMTFRRAFKSFTIIIFNCASGNKRRS